MASGSCGPYPSPHAAKNRHRCGDGPSPCLRLRQRGQSRHARVEPVSDRRICLDAIEYDDVDGCYPAKDQDVSALSAGDCIDVRIPNRLEAEGREDPLYGVEKLRPNSRTEANADSGALTSGLPAHVPGHVRPRRVDVLLRDTGQVRVRLQPGQQVH